jgi:hypothetical protein
MAGVLAGCADADPPVCHPGMPLASELRRDPAFKQLTYYLHQEPRPLKPTPYDMWADSKAEFATALQYVLARPAAAALAPGAPRECAYGISLSFRYPVRDADRPKLTAYSKAVAPAAGLDAAALEAKMLEVISSGDKYRSRDVGGKAEVWAGKLFHPARGDFFLVSLTWPRPPGSETALTK